MKNNYSIFLAASSALVASVARFAGAATAVWNGGAELNFGTAANWKANAPSNTDVAQFRDWFYNSGDTVALTSDQTIGRLAFNWATNGTVINLTLGGTHTLTLNPIQQANQGLNRTSNVAGIQTINANLLLAADQQWNIDGAGAASGAAVASNRVIVNGVISDGGAAHGFYKTGDHVLELNGANTFTGFVTVVANQLIVGNNGALGLGTQPAYIGPFSGTNGSTPSLLTKSGVTLARDIEVKSGGGAVRLGGANGSTSSIWTGNIALNRDVTLTGAYGSASGLVDFQGGISDAVDPNNAFISSNITKADKGTVKLSGANAYSGSTTVNAGTLLIDGSLSPSASVVNVNAAARLGGVGTVSRSVNVSTGGILSPGESGQGTFTVNNDQTLTLEDGAIVEWLPGVDAAHSPRVEAALLALSGTPTLKILGGANVPDASATYILSSWDGADPTTLPQWNLDPATGWSGTVSYLNASDGQPGGEVVLSGVVATATPEPAVLGLLGAMIVSFFSRPRRFRR